MDNLQEIANQFDRIVKILGHSPGYSVEWRNFKHYARITPSYRELEINQSRWTGFSDEQKLQTLIHEATHITDDRSRHEGSHKLSFWKHYVKNYYKLEENKNDIKGNYNWNKVAKLIVKDARSTNIDKRQTTVGELRNKLEEKLNVQIDDGYSRGKYSAKWDGVTEVSSVHNAGYSTQIYFREVFGKGPDTIYGSNPNEYSDEGLWKKFKRYREKEQGTGTGRFRLPKPEVKNKEPTEEERKGSIQIKPCSRRDRNILAVVQRLNGRIVPKWNSC